MGSGRALPMNVTTKKSECDSKQRIRQLEVATEHALTAAASHSNANDTVGFGMVEVSYPSFEFREALRTLRPTAGLDGIWVVIDLGSAATFEACKAACTVLGHHYPDEVFVVSTVAVPLAS
jgi:hypothetical protein